jgi:plasmid stabilization system protein ParE
MAKRLKITSRAWLDLRDIVAYISKDNPTAADRVGAELLNRAEPLVRFPELGKRVSGKTDIRVLVQRPILIFYRVEHETVRILRFWHSSRDPRSLRFD